MFKQDCFSDKRFLITGASSGLGAAIALELNALGAEVVALARDSKKLESKREKLYIKSGLSLFQRILANMSLWISGL
ncbi:SDR family NAD(P)-dependent oxidoreductase [Helicobacter bilis]|uniref:SDR family NAD(P)-dependent oxidoreductase n=1 Tax=Helicobacter bilis TaxID=37372 RepID=UPI000A800EB0|nr:SDR family NAD(P)-dependent oxidoreductase [Helicobacter bilis]